MSKLRLKDEWTTKNPIAADSVELLKDMVSSAKNGPVGLTVTLDATHSGSLINLRVYPGRFVSKQYKTFFDKKNGGSANFDKPILTHHDNYSDPIGRTIYAEYLQYKQGSDFLYDYRDPDREGEGSGVVRTKNLIVDPDAIQKIADSRYLTVSAGFRVNKMMCSICGEDLVGPEACEHMPGEFYETKEGLRDCFGITGPQVYTETSFVNSPADTAAKVVKVDYSAIKQDSEEIWFPNQKKIGGTFIHNMYLTDTETAVDLLSGDIKTAKKKTVVSFANVDKSIEDLEPDVSGEELSGSEKSGSITDGSDGKPDDRSGQVADNKKLSDETLQASIEALRKEKAKLESDLEDSKKDLEKAKADLDASVAENSKLAEDMQSMQAELVSGYARLNAHYRVQLQKPGYVDLDDESLEEKIEKELKTRSMESLQDSLKDLTLEYKSVKEADETRDSEGEKDKVDLSDEQLGSPALSPENKSRSGSSDKTVDDLFEVN